VLAELKDGKLTDATKFALSVAAFNRISQYDGAISDYLSSIQSAATRRLPASQAAASSRCGPCATANSHQQAALYHLHHLAPGHRQTAAGQRAVPITTSPTPTLRGNV
jgi:phosphoribosylaminoimidazolecarboxamide formyltransferase/IMP cyclohydrolase